MAEVEMLFSARQLSDELGITLQMLSKYAQAYTKLTKQQIKKQGREGRHFTAAQREVIKNARDLVRSKTGTTVEDAMKRALVFDSAALEVESWGDTAGFDLDRLKQALNEAVTAPLLSELQSIRGELEVMRHENNELRGKNLRPVEQSPPAAVDRQHGILVKLAMRLESLLNR
jgi:hypothetical protein